MRLTLALLPLAAPAAAWEFSPLPVCTLSAPQVTVTYDAALPEYAITLTLPAGDWPTGTNFAIRFDGDRPLTIGTDRHVIDGNRLTVRDRGFGNVLDGLQFNTTALAIAGDQVLVIPLGDAAPAVAQFRDCPGDALS